MSLTRSITRVLTQPLTRALTDPGAGGGGSPAVYPVDVVGGTAPYLAYGAIKLVEGYSGPALRVFRPSDSAEADIGFSGAKLSQAELTAFLGSQVGKVLRFYDQTGAGHHTDVQATDANRLEINIGQTLNGCPEMYGYGWTYELPSGMVLLDNAITAYALGAYINNTASGVFQFGSGGVKMFEQPGAGGAGYLFNSAIPARISPAVLELQLSPVRFGEAQDEQAGPNAGVGGGSALNGGRIGAESFGGTGYYGKGYPVAWVIYSRVLTNPDRDLMKASLLAAVGETHVAGKVFAIGDSIAAGVSASIRYNNFVRQSGKLLSKRVPVYNFGRGGHSLAQEVIDYNSAGFAGPVIRQFADNRIVIVQPGTNDIGAFGRTAAQMYADMQTICGFIRADGAKAIPATVLPNSAWNGTQQTTWSDYNTLLRANWATFADSLCDFQANAVIGPFSAASDAAKYPDGLHPSESTQTIMATIAAAAVNALL